MYTYSLWTATKPTTTTMLRSQSELSLSAWLQREQKALFTRQWELVAEDKYICMPETFRGHCVSAQNVLQKVWTYIGNGQPPLTLGTVPDTLQVERDNVDEFSKAVKHPLSSTDLKLPARKKGAAAVKSETLSETASPAAGSLAATVAAAVGITAKDETAMAGNKVPAVEMSPSMAKSILPPATANESTTPKSRPIKNPATKAKRESAKSKAAAAKKAAAAAAAAATAAGSTNLGVEGGSTAPSTVSSAPGASGSIANTAGAQPGMTGSGTHGAQANLMPATVGASPAMAARMPMEPSMTTGDGKHLPNISSAGATPSSIAKASSASGAATAAGSMDAAAHPNAAASTTPSATAAHSSGYGPSAPSSSTATNPTASAPSQRVPIPTDSEKWARPADYFLGMLHNLVVDTPSDAVAEVLNEALLQPQDLGFNDSYFLTTSGEVGYDTFIEPTF
ncbi:hypothetical protein IWQ60_003567 [Tieghemiomyces parasiticus]|uniref:Uncharacterized protein n=1 Tax=Tieghemiomyces parasiticus TaxID=78921 RepID=A0A9W8AHA5_9FUNG|nr:hypothetical protein IWQ60_003567 [Tieghemiomyces parasiticus]